MTAPEMHAMTNCPDPEILAAYEDGRLRGTEREAVTAHIADCADCRDVVVLADEVAAAEGADDESVVRGRFAWRIAAFAAAAMVVVIAGALIRDRFSGPNIEDVLKASARLDYRPSVARLSGAFPYRQPKPTYRNAAADDTTLSELPAELVQLAADLEEQNAHGIEHLHARGVTALFLGQRDQAVKILSRAAAAAEASSLPAPQKAAILNDLAVAHFESSRYGEANDKKLVTALDIIQRAWALDRTPPIAWTRAIILTDLGSAEASSAWDEYLKLDPGSPWAQEAVRDRRPRREETSSFTADRRTELLAACRRSDFHAAAEIVRRFPMEARLIGENEQLFEWAEAVQSGRRDEEARTFASLRALSATLRATSGESLLADVTASIAHSPRSRVVAMADAIRLVHEGREASLARRDDLAHRRLKAAQERLRDLETPLKVIAGLALDSLALQSDTLKATTEIPDPCDPEKRYFAACGSFHWTAALFDARHGRTSSSVERFARAAESFERGCEQENAAAVLLARAEALDSMRAGEEAWDDRTKAARLLPRNIRGSEPVQKAFALAAIRSGYSHAAKALIAGAADSWRLEPSWVPVAWPHGRGFVDSRFPQYADSHGVRRSSSTAVAGELPRGSASRAPMDLRLVYTAALAPRENEFEDIVRQLRRDVGEDAARIILSDTIRDVYRRAARVQISNGAAAAALWHSDRARRVDMPYRALSPCLRQVHPGSAEAMGRRLAECIPIGVTVVHQDLDSDQLSTWVIRTRQIRLTKTPVSAVSLRNQVAYFRDAITTRDDPEFLRLDAQQLYDALLGAVRNQIAGPGLLVYSPPPELRAVPVAALHDGRHFLVETRPLAVTATASMVEPITTVGSAGDALIVLPPLGPSREPLRGARQEVRDVTVLYGERAELLSGAAATPEAFLASVAGSDVVHLASHGQTSQRPYQNAIEFGTRTIRAYDIFSLHLRRAPIVMLAACGTADDSGDWTDVSLSTAFRAAGASAVVGSLWAVDDDATARLSVTFHRELARGIAPHDALRTAQLQLIHENAPIAAWAAFQVNS